MSAYFFRKVGYKWMKRQMVSIHMVDETDEYYDFEVSYENDSFNGVITGLRKPKGACKTILLYRVRYTMRDSISNSVEILQKRTKELQEFIALQNRQYPFLISNARF